MRSVITVTNINVKEYSISVTFECNGAISRYFTDNTLYVTYDTVIGSTPDGIAVIPFVANVLPLVWLTDSVLEIPVLDGDFYRSISEFKRGYENMYPMLDFAGEVKPLETVEHSCELDNGSGLFFSGGVDSFASLVAHAEEKIRLILILGADIPLDDHDGVKNTTAMIESAADEFGCSHEIIKSNFREFINYLYVKPLIYKAPSHYWQGFQHGIGIISLSAPLAFTLGLKKIYMASTIAPESTRTCASHHTIDNYVKFADTAVSNDLNDLSRQHKLKSIVEYAGEYGKKVFLRVCWKSKGGGNCGKCEKCLRTIAGLYAEGESPAVYGLDINNAGGCEKAVELLQKRILIHGADFWTNIQDRMRENSEKVLSNAFTHWVMTTDFASVNKPVIKKIFVSLERAQILFRLVKNIMLRRPRL